VGVGPADPALREEQKTQQHALSSSFQAIPRFRIPPDQ
jgi:hypothetical protein